MARFDVYRVKGRPGALVVDVEADIRGELASRVVIPLVPVASGEPEALPRLKPRFILGGMTYTLLTTNIAARPVTRFGDRGGYVEATCRDQIESALHFLFQGF